MRPPTPTPCTTRQAISQPVDCESPASIEPTTKMHEAGLDEQLAVEEVGELAPDRRGDRQRQQRRGDDPRVGGLAAAEVADDARQRGRDDGARQDRDEHAEHQAGHAPRAPGGATSRAGSGGRRWRSFGGGGHAACSWRVGAMPARSPRAGARAGPASAATSSSDQPSSALARRRPCGGATPQHARPASVGRSARGAAVVGVGLALDVAGEHERGDLAAGDRQVDARAARRRRSPGRARARWIDGERGEALRAELGERVARDRALHQAEAVEGDDEVFGGADIKYLLSASNCSATGLPFQPRVPALQADQAVRALIALVAAYLFVPLVGDVSGKPLHRARHDRGRRRGRRRPTSCAKRGTVTWRCRSMPTAGNHPATYSVRMDGRCWSRAAHHAPGRRRAARRAGERLRQAARPATRRSRVAGIG